MLTASEDQFEPETELSRMKKKSLEFAINVMNSPEMSVEQRLRAAEILLNNK